MASTKENVASYADWIRDTVRVQRSRYTPRLQEFLEGGNDRGNFLLLKGAGGLGKTVLTEPWRHRKSAAGRGKPENTRTTLELEFDLSAKTDRDTDDERIVDEKDQADFRWGRCLNKLKRQIASTYGPGAAAGKREIMPVFASFYDRCVSREDTTARRARSRSWVGSLSLIAGLMLILTSAVPNILGGITGYQLSGLPQLGVGLIGFCLGLLAIQQLISAAADAVFFGGHYRKLQMSPRMFRDAGEDRDAGGRKPISEAEITKVFLYDLARWYKRRSRKKSPPAILLVLDIHSFVDDANARHSLIKGIEALFHRDRKLAKLFLRLPLKVLVVSKAEALHEKLSQAHASEAPHQRAISVSSLEDSEAILMVAEILGNLQSEDLGPGTLGAAVAGIAAEIDRTPGKARLPSLQGEKDVARRISIQIIRSLASGTATDADNRAPIAVRDRTACFLAGQGKQLIPGVPNEKVILREVARELDTREQAHLLTAFGDLRAYETACLLAAFDWGLSEEEWKLDQVEAERFLAFDEIQNHSAFTHQYDPDRATDVVNLRYDARVLICAGAENFIRVPVWAALGRIFDRECFELIGPDSIPADPKPEYLARARRAIACLKVAGMREDYHNGHRFPKYDVMAPKLLSWALTASDKAKPEHARQTSKLLEEAAIASAYIIAPIYYGSSDGVLRQPSLLVPALKVITAYLEKMREAEGSVGDYASQAFRRASLPALARLDNDENLGMLAEAFGKAGESLELLDGTITRLRQLHEADPEENQTLSDLRSAYWRRKIRTTSENANEFERFASLSLTSFSPEEKLDFIETFRKLANSVASQHLNRRHPDTDVSAGDTSSVNDEAFVKAVYDRFIHVALERIRSIEAGWARWTENDRWRLFWCQIRTSLYWLDELNRVALRQGVAFVAVPGTLLSSIDELIGRLAQIDGTPRGEQLSEINAQAMDLAESFPELSRRLEDLHDAVHARGLELRTLRAEALLDSASEDTDDWRPVFQELVALVALSFRTTKHANPDTLLKLQASRKKALSLYARAVLRNAAMHPGTSRQLDLGGLEADIEEFAKAGIRAAAEDAAFKAADPENKSVGPDFSQSLLRLLARQNPSRAEARPGALVVARVREIRSVDGKDPSAPSARVVFEVPHSDLEVSIPKNFWPTGLYNQATGNSNVHTHDDRKSRHAKKGKHAWEEKLVLVILRKRKSGQRPGDPWPATARGQAYGEACLQLFSPLFANWRELKTMQASGSNQRPVSWIGASASWLVVRTSQDWMDTVLENAGAFAAHLPKLTALGRLSYFRGADEMEFPDDVTRDIDIRRFMRATYEDLAYTRGEDGVPEFFRPEGKIRSDPSLPDPWSHNKNRAFLSMFRKIYNEDARIRNWIDPWTVQVGEDPFLDEEASYEDALE